MSELPEQVAYIFQPSHPRVPASPTGMPGEEEIRLLHVQGEQAARGAAEEGEDDAPLSPQAVEALFVEVISGLPTQPLPQQEASKPRLSWQEAVEIVLSLLLLLGSAAGVWWGVLTYPGVTVTLVPATEARRLTTSLPLALRALPAVRLIQHATTPTSGTGEHPAAAARGMLTFYNGALVAQSVPQGTLLRGQDGVQVALEQRVLVPSARPPLFGQASAPARAVVPGTYGNIAAGDLNGPCCAPSLLVKNLAPFAGGQEARRFRAVAARDLDRLTAQLQAMLLAQLPTAFALHAGEALALTSTSVTSVASHRVGEEASSVTVTMTLVGQGMGYQATMLLTQARSALRAQTNPGANYRLLDASVAARIAHVAPLRVVCRGLWVYTVSQAQLQALARQIAGLSPQPATARLRQSGGIVQAIVPQALPNDPQSIHFRVVLPDDD